MTASLAVNLTLKLHLVPHHVLFLANLLLFSLYRQSSRRRHHQYFLTCRGH